MRLHRSLVLWSLVPALAVGQGSQAFQLPGKNAALLIGTDAYAAAAEWPRLSSPVFDATTIAKALAGDFSFDTTVVRNATKSEVINAIVNHGKRAAADDDWSLIFIAAHGYFDDDRSQGYLVFRDSKPRAEDVGRNTYLSLTELRAIVEGFKAGHVMLVIDACYAGTIDPDIRFGTDRAERAGPGAREMVSSLMRRSQYRSRIYLTSGGKEYVPDGRPGAHSPFAAALIGALRKASIDGRALTFNQIVGHMAASAVEPLPRHNVFRGHEPGGDFILLPKSFVAGPSAIASNAAADEHPTPARGARTSREESPPAGVRRAAGGASLASVLVKVEFSDARSGLGSAHIPELVGTKVRSAFQARGVATVIGVDARTNGFATAQSPPNCAQNATVSQGHCVEVTASVSRSIVGGSRHSVSVVLSARSRQTGQSLGSGDGRTNPYAMEIPLDRLVERAIDAALPGFVTAVLANLEAAER